MSLMEAEQSLLGKESSYETEYNPKLLFPISRKGKREEINIPEKLPFSGADIWNAYEVSWLNSKGKPQIAICSFSIPCTSPNIIESKSFKLYLNSFNQTRFETEENVKEALLKDLSSAAGTQVQVRMILPKEFSETECKELEGISLDNLDIAVEHYQVNSDFLTVSESYAEETFVSHLLKSNCLVTGQPDWASLQIRYHGPRIDKEGLLKYIISFREHLEFHEQCIERIYMDIMRICRPDKLTVYGRYTRRGGLDINPFRSNFECQSSNIRNSRQ